MDELDEFLGASTEEQPYVAGDRQDLLKKLTDIKPHRLPMYERWKNRQPNEVWDEGFTSDYTKYTRRWIDLYCDITTTWGDHEPTQETRYKLAKLIQSFEDVGAFWAGV
jgi:hypothetical protein